jgi:Tfp pilus assembly protein PilV
MSLHSTTRRALGFTLAEVLISVGILGVGMTMAAALWPAAIRENQNSANSTLGPIICENGIAVIQAKYRINAVGTKMTVLADPNAPMPDSSYPIGISTVGKTFDPNFTPSFVAMGRRLDTTSNDVQLFVFAVSSHTLSPTGTMRVKMKLVQYDEDPNSTSTTLSTTNTYQIGAPIFTNGGQLATVMGVDTIKHLVTLDHPLSPEGTPTTVFTLMEWDVLGGFWSTFSPVMYSMTTRTALRP